MHRMMLDIPSRIETERLLLRPLQPGDGPWYHTMSQRNRSHLEPFESGNVALTIQSEQDAEIVVRELAAAWHARTHFFLTALDRTSSDFVAQIYIGPLDWELPSFIIGYFVDLEREGQGYVTEAVRATLRMLFDSLHAHRVCVEMDSANSRSVRVAERCGFAQEGHFRQNKLRPDGTFGSTLHYGMLRSDYEAQVPTAAATG